MFALKRRDVEGFMTRLRRAFDFFDLTESRLPPKAHLFPPVEETFSVDLKGGSICTPPPPRPFVLYGLSLRDLEAIRHLDEIMSAPQEDFYYFRRRRRALVIGVTSECFDVPPGGDMILVDNGKEGVRLVIVTERGALAVKKHLPGLKPAGERVSCTLDNRTMPELRRLLMDAEHLKEAVEWSWRWYPAIWKRLEEECLACGVCTYVCPLCHCFSTEDSVALSGKSAARCRRWDACTMPGFSRMASGEDPHPTRRERYYNWYYHKFVRGYLEFGRAECVACGRCQRECPARIDIERVLTEIATRYEDARRRALRGGA